MKFLTIFLLIAAVNADNYECLNDKHETEPDDSHFYQTYTCHVSKINSDDSGPLTITGATGEHIFPHLDNSDLRGLSIENMPLEGFPRNLHNVFSKLERLTLASTGLKTLTSEDMQGIGVHLRSLILYNNKIEVIKSDVFTTSIYLKVLSLHDNGIKKVEWGAFKNLANLHTLNFDGNTCVSDSVFLRPDVIQQLFIKIYQNCKDE